MSQPAFERQDILICSKGVHVKLKIYKYKLIKIIETLHIRHKRRQSTQIVMRCWDSQSQASFGKRNICYNFLNCRFYTRFSILYNNNVYSINYSIASGLGIAWTNTQCVPVHFISTKRAEAIYNVAINRIWELQSDLWEIRRPEVNMVPTNVMKSSFFFPVWEMHAVIHFLLLHSCSSRCWKKDNY